MARPIYESPSDKARESEVAQKIGRLFGVRAVKLPFKNSMDYAPLKGRAVKAVVEIKTRTTPKAKYPTYMLSLGKWNAACSIARSGVPAFIIVQWSDCIAWKSVDPLQKVNVEIGGRCDRGDDNDVELVVMIDHNEFKIIEGGDDDQQ